VKLYNICFICVPSGRFSSWTSLELYYQLDNFFVFIYRYSFDNVLAGHYVVRAQHPDYLFSKVSLGNFVCF